MLFGPAIVEAYQLESKVAYYPRIILSDKAARTIAAGENPRDAGLHRDGDGCWYLDIFDLFPGKAELQAPKGTPDRQIAEYLHRLERPFATSWRRHIGAHLRLESTRRQPDLNRLAKLRWLAREFNRYVKRRKPSGVEPLDIDNIRVSVSRTRKRGV